MSFKTKINMSENRLVKQDINTTTHFKGSNVFSVPLEERRLGADYPNAHKQIIETNIFTDFEYITENDVLRISFKNAEMESSSENIPEIDFDNPEDYFVMPVFVGSEPYIIDEVTFYKQYSGYEYDLIVNDVEKTEFGYKGTFLTTELLYVEADSLDYVGDNTVLTVNGNLYADKIISKPILNIIKINGNYTISKNTNYHINDIFFSDGSITINGDLPIGQIIRIITTSGNISVNEGELINADKIMPNNMLTIVSLGEKKLFIH